VLAPDFLGFGASEKPREHRYALSEQADLIESLWEQARIDSTAIDEAVFSIALAPTFADDFDAAEDTAAIWQSISRDKGQRIMHLLIHYMPDRERHAERWTGALEQTDVPRSFVWGMLDPVSGAHMAERIRERLPDALLRALGDVGHWPQLEAPETVAAALLDSIQ
jgi:pimeloyl-ACP methyl ester carboxylesterase